MPKLRRENISFSFYSTNNLFENQKIIWTIVNADGESLNYEGETISLMMEKGGFVVSASIEENITIVNNAEELKYTLENLQPDANRIILSGNSNFFETETIYIDPQYFGDTEVEILSKGRRKEIRLPSLNIVANDVLNLRFSNIDFVWDCKLKSSSFINCSGVDGLYFNNCEFTIDIDEKTIDQDLIGVDNNFVNFDGTKLDFSNFKQNPLNANTNLGFITISGIINNRLSSVRMSNCSVFTGLPFYINFDFTYPYQKGITKELNIDIDD